MSYEAIEWALRDAPGVPPACVAVLFGLARHADKQGCGAYPSNPTLAAYARKSERQVRYDLRQLAELGLIRPGDQGRTAHLPGNRRSFVYDLALELRAPAGGQPIAPVPGVQPIAPLPAGQPIAPLDGGGQPIAPQTADDLAQHLGGQPIAPLVPESQGGNGAHLGGQPIAAKRSTNLNQGSVGANSSGSNTARKHAVADDLAAAFWEHHKASTAQPFLGIRGVIRTAIANGLPRNDVARALDQLAKEGRAISGGSITNAIADIRKRRDSNGGHQPYRNPADPSAYETEELRPT